MMHKLFKEHWEKDIRGNFYRTNIQAQDANECTPDDWKQTDIIRANLEAEYAKRFNDLANRQLKETNHELKITLLLTLGFTTGFFKALLTIVGTKL